MNITTIDEGGLRGRRHPRHPREAGRRAGLPRARRLRRPRHHPAGQRRTSRCSTRTRRASRSSSATTPQRSRNATASAPSSTPRSPPSSARPATTCSASPRSARRPPSSGSASTARLDGHPRARRRDQGRRRREPARATARTPCATDGSTAWSTDVELPVGPTDLDAPDRSNEEAVREIFGRLEFRTLLDRVLKLEGSGTTAGAEGAAEIARRRPAAFRPRRPRACSSTRSCVPGSSRPPPPTPTGSACPSRRSTARSSASASRAPPRCSTCRGRPDRADYPPFEAWLASDAPKIMHRRQGAAQGAEAQRPRRSAASAPTPSSPAGCCARAGRRRPSPQLVQRYLRRGHARGPTPTSWSPTTPWSPVRRSRPGTRCASPPLILGELSEGSRSVLTDIEIPVLLALVDMELARRHRRATTQLSALSSELGETAAGTRGTAPTPRSAAR